MIWLIASEAAYAWVSFIAPFLLGLGILLSFVRQRGGLHLSEAIWGAAPVGYLFFAWASWLASCLYNDATPGARGIPVHAISAVYIFGSLLAYGFVTWQVVRLSKEPAFGATVRLQFKTILTDNFHSLLFLIALAYFTAIYYTHALMPDKEGNVWSGGAYWSDLAFHLNVMSSFLWGHNSDSISLRLSAQPQSSIFAGYPLSYPFIPDFHSATFVTLGFSLRQSLLVPSIVLTVSFSMLIYCFVLRLFGADLVSTSSELKKIRLDRQRAINDPDSFKGRIPIHAITSGSLATTRRGRGAELAAFLAVFLWMLSGGVGGWTMLRDKPFNWDTIMGEDWIQKCSDGTEIYWFAAISHVLLPQRSATYAYPLNIVLFSLFHAMIYEHNPTPAPITDQDISASAQKKKKKKTKQTQTQPILPGGFLFCGIVMGLLPLVHVHSYVTVGIIAICLALFNLRRSLSLFPTGKSRKEGLFTKWLAYGLPGLLLALPQIMLYNNRLEGGDADGNSFVKLLPIWRNQPWARYWQLDPLLADLNAIPMWFNSLGFMIPLALLSYFFLQKKAQRHWCLSFWAIFVITNVVQFQPWDKDNNKIFLIWLVGIVGGVSGILVRWWRTRSLVAKAFVPLLLVSLIFSGALISTRELYLRWQYMDTRDLDFGKWLRTNTDPDAVFVTNQSHIHTVSNMAGKASFYSFEGWIHSHGYPRMWERRADMVSMVSGNAPASVWRKHGVKYVVFDWTLTHDVPTANRSFFDTHSLVHKVYDDLKYALFDVSRLASL